MPTPHSANTTTAATTTAANEFLYSPSNTIFAMADWRIPRLGFLGIVPEISADVRGAATYIGTRPIL